MSITDPQATTTTAAAADPKTAAAARDTVTAVAEAPAALDPATMLREMAIATNAAVTAMTRHAEECGPPTAAPWVALAAIWWSVPALAAVLAVLLPTEAWLVGKDAWVWALVAAVAGALVATIRIAR